MAYWPTRFFVTNPHECRIFMCRDKLFCTAPSCSDSSIVNSGYPAASSRSASQRVELPRAFASDFMVICASFIICTWKMKKTADLPIKIMCMLIKITFHLPSSSCLMIAIDDLPIRICRTFIPMDRTVAPMHRIVASINASSAESVGGLRLGEVARLMVKGNAQMLEVPISKGSSHRVAYFQIELQRGM